MNTKMNNINNNKSNNKNNNKISNMENYNGINHNKDLINLNSMVKN